MQFHFSIDQVVAHQPSNGNCRCFGEYGGTSLPGPTSDRLATTNLINVFASHNDLLSTQIDLLLLLFYWAFQLTPFFRQSDKDRGVNPLHSISTSQHVTLRPFCFPSFFWYFSFFSSSANSIRSSIGIVSFTYRDFFCFGWHYYNVWSEVCYGYSDWYP